jgi:hypothetical protein
MMRASYGRFSQGVLTGEISPFHPAVPPITTMAFERTTGAYTRVVSVVDSGVNLRFDPGTRAPRTDEYSVGLDRELGRRLAVAVAYVRKRGANFIGWTDVGGTYVADTRTLSGRVVPVAVLVNSTADRRFLLTNPDGYSMHYDGLVMVVERRRSQGWQAFGSYTWSRAEGLQAASGTTAAGAQVSTVAPPNPITFGRDPNDLTNARGRLANDRPRIARLMGSVDVPRTGFVIAANLQSRPPRPGGTAPGRPQCAQRHGGGSAGYRQHRQPDLRPAHNLHGSAPGNARSQNRPGPAAMNAHGLLQST